MSIPFKIPSTTVGAKYSAYVRDGEDIAAAVAEAAMDAIDLDIEIEAGGVTMSLAAWRNPDHWAEDWKKALDGASFDDYISGLVTED
jgi:hypothetical protein